MSDHAADTLESLHPDEHRLLTAIANATPLSMGYIDRGQRFQFANTAYAAEHRCGVEEIIGKRVEEFLGPDRYRVVKPNLEASLHGEQRTFEVDAWALPGDPLQLSEITLVPDRDCHGEVAGCHVIVVDITQQRQKAIDDAQQHQKLQLALKTARMGIWEWVPRLDQLTWNDSFAEVFGYPEMQWDSGKSASMTMEEFIALVHPEDREALSERIQCARDGFHEEFEAEYRVIHGSSGQVVWTYGNSSVYRDADGEITKITSVLKDATQQRRSEQKLAANEHRLQRVVDGASVGIAFAKTCGQVVTANDAALRMLGVTRASFDREGYNWMDSIRTNDRAQARAVVQELKSSGRMPPRELLLQHRTGNLQPVQVSSLSVSTNEEEHVVFMVDLADQKRSQQSLDEARKLAEAANNTKSEFLANMSHEIRTPMSAIMGYLEILSRNLTQPDDLKCISVIRHNSQFLLDIINDILDISKIEAGKLALHKKRFQPAKLLADVRSLMDVRAAEKDLELSIHFDGKIPKTIRSDDKRLKQILVNLLGNAIKFTESGAIELRVSYVADQESLSLEVTDTGIGMSPKLIGRLFQPFTQGDSSLNREFSGTGLGLNISQRLAHLLGGEIKVASEVGKGSKFSLRIATGSLKNVPLVNPNLSVINADAQDLSSGDLPTLSGRILVVDDRRDIRHIAKLIVQDAGGLVDEAEDGKRAIEAIERASIEGDPFDLIVMDMQMPVMDGYEATRRLRQSGFDRPIIALTAHAMRGDRQRCLDAGCTDYLTKPLDRTGFLRLLASYQKGAEVAESPRPRRVLIVEDQHESADVLGMLLESDGHVIAKAYDGARALEQVTTFRPEVVLLDLGLPDMSGFEVLESIRSIQSDSPVTVIAMTGRDNDHETLEAGFNHHVLKPVDLDKLNVLLAR